MNVYIFNEFYNFFQLIFLAKINGLRRKKRNKFRKINQKKKLTALTTTGCECEMFNPAVYYRNLKIDLRLDFGMLGCPDFEKGAVLVVSFSY